MFRYFSRVARKNRIRLRRRQIDAVREHGVEMQVEAQVESGTVSLLDARAKQAKTVKDYARKAPELAKRMTAAVKPDQNICWNKP